MGRQDFIHKLYIILAVEINQMTCILHFRYFSSLRLSKNGDKKSFAKKERIAMVLL